MGVVFACGQSVRCYRTHLIDKDLIARIGFVNTEHCLSTDPIEEDKDFLLDIVKITFLS